MMLHENNKALIRSLHDDTDYSDIVAGVLRAEILAPYMFIMSQN